MFIFGWLWNIVLTLIIIALFVPWWGFIFGSVIGVILILVFAPALFFLPAWLAVFYWSEY